MKVALINVPNTGRITVDLAPPLWALLLGAVAREAGAEVDLVDLNLEVAENLTLGGPELYGRTADRLLEGGYDVVAFSSMAVNSHIGLEVARRVKAAAPSVVTVFGGPHFGACAATMMGRYPWMDYVAVGPAERSFASLLETLATSDNRPIVGMFSRREGRVTGQPFADPVEPADVPRPAYELAQLGRYFALNPSRVIDFDAGQRGCVFRCSFCYSPRHFGRGERRQDPDRFVDELAEACSLGGQHFFFVQDHFVNSPPATIDLCRRIERAGLGLTFHCYSTLDRLTQPVVDALARAGCRSVYVGVDAVHKDDRRAFRKGLYRGRDDLFGKIHLCLEAGIRPTLAFMLQDVEVGRDRFEETVATAMAVRSIGCPIRLNTLTLYPGTASYDAHRGAFSPDDTKPRLAMDLPEVVCENTYALEAPDLFPFHATHLSPDRHAAFLLRVHTLDTLAHAYPETLLGYAEAGRSWELASELVEDLDPRREARRPDLDRRGDLIDRFRRRSSRAVGRESSFAQEDLVVRLNARARSPRLWVRTADGAVRELRHFEVEVGGSEGPSHLAVMTGSGVLISRVTPRVARYLAEHFLTEVVESTMIGATIVDLDAWVFLEKLGLPRVAEDGHYGPVPDDISERRSLA